MPGVAQRVDRGIALLFHDRGTWKWWVVSSTPRSQFTPGKDPVPILQEVGWAPGPVWTDGKSRPHRDSIPNRPARSSVAIPTELPGPHAVKVFWTNRGIGAFIHNFDISCRWMVSFTIRALYPWGKRTPYPLKLGFSGLQICDCWLIKP